MTKTPHLPLALAAALLLSACNPAPAPVAEAPAPIIQNKQVRFAPGHPQLALLTASAAAPGSVVQVDMPAKLVWNEENTQRVYPALSGRVVSIHSDVSSLGSTPNSGDTARLIRF